MATSLLWTLFCSGEQSLPKKPPDVNGQVFKELMKKSRMVIQFDLYGTWMINPGNCMLTVFH